MWVLLLATALLCLTSAATEPTPLDKLFTRLWNCDRHRIEVGSDLQLNWQDEVSERDRVKDKSSGKLCTLKTQKLDNSSVHTAFKALLDNYKADVGMSETETEAERREQDTFLNRLIERPVIKEVHKYLVSIHLAPADREGFKRLLRNVWFAGYERRSPNDSSAFEHVFLGEKNKGKVSGFHNWFVFCDQEANGDIDYHGFYRSFKNQPEGNFKRTLRFKWKNLMKEKSTLLFGASVEFELGLYTTIYLISKQSQKWRCVPVQIGQVRTCVQCYDHKGHMGTCFAM